MNDIFFDVLELNLALSPVIVFLGLFSGKLRKRYGAGCMKCLWILLAIRLLIPYNFSLPNTEVRFFSGPIFGQEGVVGPTLSGVVPESPKEQEEMAKIPAGAMPQPTTFPEGGLQAVVTEPAAKEENVQAPETETFKSRISYSAVLTSLWLLGCFAFLFYHGCCYLQFFLGSKKYLRKVPSRETAKLIAVMQKRLLGKNFPVFLCEKVTSPMLMGVVHPKIVLPISVDGWTEEELEWVLAHELTHYRNQDILLKWILNLACCVNWFNPMVHWMKRQCFYEMELACDGKVLEARSGKERERYARLMLSFARSTGRETSYATGFSGSKKCMKGRIDYVLSTKKRRKGRLFLTWMCVAVLLLTSLVSCGYKPLESDGIPSSSQENEGESLESDENSRNSVDDNLPEGGTSETAGEESQEPIGENISSVASQLRLLSQCKNLWAQEMDYDAEGSFCAITDLDGNGRLEVIVSSIRGTGVFSYSRFYEVNEACDEVVECETDFIEGNSEPDLLMFNWEVYRDAAGQSFYVLADDMKNGAAEYYQFIYALSLQDGRISSTLLAGHSCIYEDSIPKKQFRDSAGREITEQQYNRAAEAYFAGYSHSVVSIGWQDMRELPEDAEGIYEKLCQSHKVYSEGLTGEAEQPQGGEEESGALHSYVDPQYLNQIEETVTVPGTDICYAMYVVDAALGSRMYGLLKSTDGGVNWYLQSGNPFGDEMGGSVEFTFLDEFFGFATLSHNGGDTAKLYVTEDGGLSYQPVKLEGNRKVTLADGTEYEPCDYPRMPYYEEDQLLLRVEQGADGDYHSGDQIYLAKYISIDHGKTFTFLE